MVAVLAFIPSFRGYTLVVIGKWWEGVGWGGVGL